MRKNYLFCIIIQVICIATCLQGKDDFLQAKENVKRGFQTPKFETNFPSVQLFSVADIGPKTYNVNYSTSLKMTRSADYKPVNELKGSPMIHVKASTVIIDFNGATITKSAVDSNGNPTENCVGLEVGYSPREIAADSSLQQPHDVIIRNGVISDFDIGVIVHTGVQNVTFENISIYNSVVGCVCLGLQSPASGAKGKVVSCTFRHVKITGKNVAGRTVLVGGKAPLDWAKAKIENVDSTGLNGTALGHGYGSDVFMPFAHNPVADDTTALVYSGMVCDTVENVLLSDVMIHNFGFNGDIAGSAESSVVRGIVLKDSSSVFAENIQSLNHVSALSTIDIFLENITSCSLQHAVFSDSAVKQVQAATSAQGLTAYGLYALGSDAVTCEDIVFDRHVAVDNAYPIYLINGNIYEFTHFSADNNQANFVQGIHANNIDTISVKHGSANYNIATTTGSFSAGFNFNNCESVIVNDCSINQNQGGDFAGIMATQPQSYTFTNIEIDGNGGAGKCIGLYANSSITACFIDGMYINNNFSTGNDVTGIHMQNARAVTMKNVTCNYNNSTSTGGNVVGVLFEAVGGGVTGVESLDMQQVEINNNFSTVAAKTLQGLVLQNGDGVQCAHLSICNNSGISNVSGFVGTTKLINSTFNVCKVDGNSSSGGAVKGMTFDDADHVVCKECSASGNITSAGTSSVHGIEFVALQNVEMKCMQTSNNVSFGSHVYGLSMANGKAVTIDGLSSNFNQSDSDSIAYGLRATGSLTGSQLLHVSCDSNLGGISVYGIDIENAQSVTCTALSAVSNKAAENARGLYMHTGNIISCKQGNFSGNTVTVSGISSENSLQTVELSKHAPSHLSTGAYGMYCSNLNGLLCSDIEASRNSGFRCSGVVAHGITESVFKNCITSYQRATGNYFIDTPFSGVDMTVIPVQANQVSTIFGGISDTTLVNAKDAMTTMLLSVMALKDLQDSCEINPENTVQYGYLKSLVSTQLLLRAIIAQFRRFGTAIGLHLHNCTNCHVYDHTAHGNVSEKDSGIGLAMTGTSVGHICKQGSFSGNEGWTDSKRQSDVDKTIDISEVLPFWQALGMKMLTADNVDTTTNIVGSITQSHLSWLPATRSAPYTHIGRLTVSFNTDTGPFYELVHPVGGIGAGVIVGDAAENIKIKDVIASNNRSGAGQAYGILQDVTTSCVVQDSQMYQMFANTLGYAYGLAEFNFQSNSIHSGNVLFGNAIENMLNANYLVPYDPTNFAQLSFQVKKIYNGDFSQMANILPYDNIEIEFIGKRSADRNLPDNVKEDWLSTYTS